MANREAGINRVKYPPRKVTITWEDPMIGPKVAMGMSGLDYLRAIKSGKLPFPPFMKVVDFKIRKIEVGHVVFDLKPAEYHYNLMGTVHGGVTSTILDSAMASANQTTLPVGTRFATVEFKVNFFHPVSTGTGLVKCEARVIHAGSRVATAEGKLLDKNGKLYAHGTLTCLIFRGQTKDL